MSVLDCPDELAERLKRANDLLLLAYNARGREGWEPGPSEDVVHDWIVDHLYNEDLDPGLEGGKKRLGELLKDIERREQVRKAP